MVVADSKEGGVHKILSKMVATLLIVLVGSANAADIVTDFHRPSSALIPAPVSMKSFHQFAFKGFYVGVDAGYYGNIFQFNSIQTGDAQINAFVLTRVINAFNESVLNSSIAGNLYLGYMFTFKRMFIGIDAQLLLADTRYSPVTQEVFKANAGGINFGTPLRTETTIQADSTQPGLEFRPGLTISNRFAVYFLLGVLYTHMKLLVNNFFTITDAGGVVTSASLSVKTSKDMIAPEFGLGVLFALSRHVYLTLLDRCTIFNSLKVNGAAPTTTAAGTISDGLTSVNKTTSYNNSVFIGLLFRI